MSDEHYRRLAWQMLPEGGLRLRVISDSMAPLLRRGDWVVAAPLPPEFYAVGDIVVARRGGDTLTHRLIRITANGWLMKGDRVGWCDPLIPLDAAGALAGRVDACERNGRVMDLRTAGRVRAGRWMAWLGWWEARAHRWPIVARVLRAAAILTVYPGFFFHRRG